MNEFILQENDRNILIVKLNRPPDNFIKLPVLEQLGNAMDAVIRHGPYEGLILTSAIENVFISGHEVIDLHEEQNERKLKKYLLSTAELLLSIQRLSLPTVTLINGHCVGFGLELALCTDFRIAVEGDINIGFPEVRLGTFPPFGGIYRLVKLAGETRAKELLMKGRLLKPATALEWGLIDGVSSKAAILEDAIKLIKGFSKNGPLAMTAVKRSIVDASMKDFMSVVREDIEDYSAVIRSGDYSEGKKALREGRVPAYKRS